MAIFDELNCTSCGCLFGMPQGYLNNRRGDKQSFFCPNGHQMSYTESTADKLRRERDLLKQQMVCLEDEKRDAWASANAQAERAQKAEAATKRLKKRSSAGTCPCCSRTFSNMSQHMLHQHPEFVADGGTKVIPIKRRSTFQ